MCVRASVVPDPIEAFGLEGVSVGIVELPPAAGPTPVYGL